MTDQADTSFLVSVPCLSKVWRYTFISHINYCTSAGESGFAARRCASRLHAGAHEWLVCFLFGLLCCRIIRYAAGLAFTHLEYLHHVARCTSCRPKEMSTKSYRDGHNAWCTHCFVHSLVGDLGLQPVFWGYFSRLVQFCKCHPCAHMSPLSKITLALGQAMVPTSGVMSDLSCIVMYS